MIPAGIRWPPENAGGRIVNRNVEAASGRPSARGAAIASTMLGPCVLRTVAVDVSKIPRLAGNDQTAAAGARHITRRDTRLPQPAKSLVVRPITALDSLLRSHHRSTLKKEGEKRRLRRSRAGSRWKTTPRLWRKAR